MSKFSRLKTRKNLTYPTHCESAPTQTLPYQSSELSIWDDIMRDMRVIGTMICNHYIEKGYPRFFDALRYELRASGEGVGQRRPAPSPSVFWLHKEDVLCF